MKESVKFLSTFCSILQIIGFICIVLISKPIGAENHLLFVSFIIAGGIAAIVNWFLQSRTILSDVAAICGIGLVIGGFLLY